MKVVDCICISLVVFTSACIEILPDQEAPTSTAPARPHRTHLHRGGAAIRDRPDSVADALASRLADAKSPSARAAARLEIARARVVDGGSDCQVAARGQVVCRGPQRARDAVDARYRADFEGRSREVALETFFDRCFRGLPTGGVVALTADPLCALLASELSGAAAPGENELERREVAALLRDAGDAFAGRSSSLPREPGSGDEAAQAELLAKARATSDRWRREVEEHAELVRTVVAWGFRSNHTRWSASDDDRVVCRSRVPEAFAAGLHASRGAAFGDVRERARTSPVLSLLLDVHSMCHETGAFGEGPSKTVTPKALYTRGRYEWLRDPARQQPYPLSLGGTVATVAAVAKQGDTALVTFAPIEDVDEQFSNCVATNKIAGYVRNGRDLDVRYEQRCQVRRLKVITALAPITVDPAIAAALARGTVVVLDRPLSRTQVKSAAQSPPLSAEPAHVEWAFARGAEIRAQVPDDAKVVVALHHALSP